MRSDGNVDESFGRLLIDEPTFCSDGRKKWKKNNLREKEEKETEKNWKISGDKNPRRNFIYHKAETGSLIIKSLNAP